MAENTFFCGTVHHGCKVEAVIRLYIVKLIVFEVAVSFAGRLAMQFIAKKGLNAHFGWF